MSILVMTSASTVEYSKARIFLNILLKKTLLSFLKLAEESNRFLQWTM